MSKIQIVVTFDNETGQCQVSGPINDKILIYGLLGMAKEIVSKQEVKLSSLVLPEGNVLPMPHAKGN
jgi:hypothetical protein